MQRRHLRGEGGRAGSDPLVAAIATRVVRAPLPELRDAIGATLEAVGRRTAADRVTIRDVSGPEASLCQAWCREGCGPPEPIFPAPDLPWLMRQALEGRTISFRSVADLPREAARERRLLARHGPRSAAVVPVVVGGATIAALVVGTMRRERPWGASTLAFLEQVAVVLGGALARQRAKDASLELEARLAAVLDTAMDGILLVRPDGAIDAANGRAVDIFLRAREELCGAHLQDLLATATDAPRPVRTRLDALLGSDAPAELLARRGDGSTIPVAVTAHAVRSQGACCVVRDLTADQRAREETARLRGELAFLGRTALVAEMGAGVAHELNQPLTAILSNAETAERLVRSRRARDRAELAETLGDVIADTRRAAEVIGRMRDMLRRRPVERVAVDVAALLASVARRFREAAVVRAVRLTVEVAPGLPPVAGDPVQLEQVATNLVLNALEALGEAAGGPGGGAREIAVRARSAGPEGVDVSVRDTGPGLGEEALARAFDAFFTTKPGGLGMGLGISRSIVEAHGGRLLARNNGGGGATFEFHLPAAPRAASSRIRRRPA
jgi:two-component system sensor kinase FixL